MDSDYLVPSTTPVEDAIPVTIEMVMRMKVNELKDVYRKIKLGLGGKKKDILNRIKKEIEDGKEIAILAPTVSTNMSSQQNKKEEE